MNASNRIRTLPPYLFAQIDEKVAKARKEGKDIINLSIGDPDLETPKPIVEKLQHAAENPNTHHYPSYVGMNDLRQEISNWLKKRFNIKFGSDEICALGGSKEGIAHLPLGILNPGDYGIYPDPGYPVYRTSIMFANGNPIQMPLKEENKFLPDLDELNKRIKNLGKKKPKLLFLNYPNNPTAAVTDLKFLKEVVALAIENEILICYDNAYSEMTYDNYLAPSIFQVKDADKTAIEMFSFSKTYNMTGWRIGFAVGRSENLSLLKKVKENFDSGVFNAIQIAAIEALRNKEVEKIERQNMKIFEERRDIACEKLNELGVNFEKPKATFYLWVKINKEKFKTADLDSSISMKFCDKAIERGVVLTPGVGFGEYGEGFVRIAITQNKEKIAEGIERIKDLF